jgi:hypothetical protein
MLKKFLYSVILVLFIFIAFFIYRVSQVAVKPIHYHANFAVFKNNTQVNFTDFKYMHTAPCYTNDQQNHSTDKLDNVHLHDNIGNVVHVHIEGVTWKDLFTSLKYDVKNLNYYLNGKKTDAKVLSQRINPYDKFLATDTAQVNDHERSRMIGDNAHDYDVGKKGIENCGSEGDRTLFQRMRIALQNML